MSDLPSLSVKVYSAGPSGPSIRRFRVPAKTAFEAVAKRLGDDAIQAEGLFYIDDENDRIRINSQEELEECHRIIGAPLRLFLGAENEEEKRRMLMQSVQVSMTKSMMSSQAGVASSSFPPSVPRAFLPASVAPVASLLDPRAGLPPVSYEFVRFDPSKAASDINADQDDQKLHWTVYHILGQAPYPGYLRPAIRLGPESAAQSKLQVDLDQLFEALTNQGLSVIKETPPQAEKLFQQALTLNGNDWQTRYNLACAQALAGRSLPAITTLRTAFEHGFRMVDHLADDPDFASLHKLPAWKSLVEEMRAGKGSSANAAPPPGPPVPVPVNPAEATSVAAKVEVLKRVGANSWSEDAVRKALASTDNNIDHALQKLMGPSS